MERRLHLGFASCRGRRGRALGHSFWLISKMGGLTEVETLKSWSVVSALLGLTGLAITLILALVLPLA